MFQLCQSVQITTEHKHYYEKIVEFKGKEKKRVIEGRNFNSQKKIEQKIIREQHSKFDGEGNNIEKEEISVRPKGIKIASKNQHNCPSPKHKRWKSDVGFKNQQPLIVIPNPQLTISAPLYHNETITCNFSQKSENSIPKSIPTIHIPHPILSRNKPPLLTVSKFSIQSDPFSCKSFLFPYSTEKEENNNNNSQLALNKTQKRLHTYDPRHSQQTELNNNKKATQLRQTRMKKTRFNKEMPSICINIPTNVERNSVQIDLLSPTKIKKNLQDAKSIVSRDDSLSGLDEVKLEESILLKRQIDMFDFISPIDEINGLQIARAVDHRDGSFVTLQFFQQYCQNQYYHELDILRKVEGHRTSEQSFKILKFRQIFMQDTFQQKKIILVFQPFQVFLHECFQKTQPKNLQQEKLILSFLSEVKELLATLLKLKIVLASPLKLQDFVWIGNDWRLLNLSKFTVNHQKTEIIEVSKQMLKVLEEEFQQAVF